ncbi:hypothetical protein XM38_001080 [Halomicronema hongdechloris C2206]|uniref:2TM domain-containing protein n=1 Tax=Halomicronema hongdechloris C2206 TaxID=1641165 RepID=A0A1Z3HFX0_9CYAN|nr:2TM domain-containing protein [Halomicronema hongdechloris]ASC69182.1 hypothetical protein XM38_001080 [Halomicronema hongdechloris C2206]
MAEQYASEDAQQILHLAIARQTEGGELTRTQLLEIASELGIAPETLAAAEQEWEQRKSEFEELKLFEEHRRQRFQSHLVRYVIVNLFLLALNFLTTGGFSFALFVILAWGLGLSLHAWHTYQPNKHRYYDEFEKWRRRRQLRQSFTRMIDRLLGT